MSGEERGPMSCTTDAHNLKIWHWSDPEVLTRHSRGPLDGNNLYTDGEGCGEVGEVVDVLPRVIKLQSGADMHRVSNPDS
jgi:hypothetical protein